MIKTKQELLNHFSDINFMYNNPFTYQTLSNMIDELLEQQPKTETHGSTYGGVSWGGTYKPQQPCEDCISREETLKAFAEKCGGECGCSKYNGSGYDTAENCKLIKSMPSVTPKTGWIPVSERLPEIHQDVFLSLRSLDVLVGFRGETEPYFYCEGDYIEPQNVLAWMPLPQPYKAESEE